MDQHELVENSSHNHGYEAEHDHVVGLPIYFGVFAILMVGTFLTVATALFDLDWIFPFAEEARSGVYRKVHEHRTDDKNEKANQSVPREVDRGGPCWYISAHRVHSSGVRATAF